MCCHSWQVQSCNLVFKTCLLPFFVSLTSASHNEDFSADRCEIFLLLLYHSWKLVPFQNITNYSYQFPQGHDHDPDLVQMSCTGKSFNSFTLLLKLSAKLLLIWSHLM